MEATGVAGSRAAHSEASTRIFEVGERVGTMPSKRTHPKILFLLGFGPLGSVNAFE